MNLNWCYGAVSAPQDYETFAKFLRRDHQLRNELCELELLKRSEYNKALANNCQGLTELDFQIEQSEKMIESIYNDIRKANSDNRKSQGASASQKQAIAQEKESLRQLYGDRKTLVGEWKATDAAKALLSTLALQHKGRVNQLYQVYNSDVDCGYWPRWNYVVKSNASMSSGGPPRFKRFDGEGAITYQVQGKITAEEALACTNSKLKIQMLDGGNARVYVRSRVVDRLPSYITVDVKWHRDFPPGAIISEVFLHQHIQANYKRWSVRFTIWVPSETRLPTKCDDLVTIHLGWRQIGGDMRVATWEDGDGNRESLFIPQDRLRKQSSLGAMQGYRDTRFNEEIAWFCNWIDDNKSLVPEWLLEHRKAMKSWKTQSRLAGLCIYWRDHRFNGDDEPFKRLEGDYQIPQDGWRRWDKHMWQQIEGSRKRNIRWRNDTYRNIAKNLAAKYGRASLIVVDWSKLLEKASVEDPETIDTSVRRNGSFAAVGTLSQYIKEAFGEDCIIEIDAKNVTRECSACSYVNKDPKHHRYVVCSGCGEKYEVDENAVTVERARGEVVMKSLPPLATVMHQRVMAEKDGPKRSERYLKMHAARKRKPKSRQSS